MSNNYKCVFRLLPLLFHYHSSLLPGYQDYDVIHGIANYVPDPELFSLLGVSPLFFDTTPYCSPRIAGLYSMGSTSSLGQSIYSDLDVWICVERLTTNEKKALKQKCKLVESWANIQGVKLSLFVVDVNRFKDDHLGGDNCNSRQRTLLLEEFYRTANVLAGKLILWFRVPHDFKINGRQYLSYKACVQALLEQKIVNSSEWMDLGELNQLSSEDYFCTSLWQFCKSIDFPYKAVLKSLLLEVYSWEYPDTLFIAYEMNQLLHNYRLDYFCLDPYYMLLEKVTHYLIKIGDHKRLELVRQCFYIKTNEKLTNSIIEPNWRREILVKLVKQWGWSYEKLLLLDNYDRWKKNQLVSTYNNLFDVIVISYRNLFDFGERERIKRLPNFRRRIIVRHSLSLTHDRLPCGIFISDFDLFFSLSMLAFVTMRALGEEHCMICHILYNKLRLYCTKCVVDPVLLKLLNHSSIIDLTRRPAPLKN